MDTNELHCHVNHISSIELAIEVLANILGKMQIPSIFSMETITCKPNTANKDPMEREKKEVLNSNANIAQQN